MVTAEFERSGAIHFQTALINDYDGLNFEVRMQPDRSVEAKMVDDRDGMTVGEVKLEAQFWKQVGGERLVKLKVMEEAWPQSTLLWNWEEKAQVESQAGLLPDLLHLVAWFMAESGNDVIEVEDRFVLEKEVGRVKEVLELAIGESRLSQFFAGEEVGVRGGFWAQARYSMLQPGGMNYEVGMSLRDERDRQGYLDGVFMTQFSDGLGRLKIGNWSSRLEGDRPVTVLLGLSAMMKRFLESTFQQEVVMVFRNGLVGMSAEDTLERSKYWLGF